jgi:hypothetical protein
MPQPRVTSVDASTRIPHLEEEEDTMPSLNWKDSTDKTWSAARAPRAIGGRYVISRQLHCWNVDHRRQKGKMRQQLGFAYTAEEAKKLAQTATLSAGN